MKTPQKNLTQNSNLKPRWKTLSKMVVVYRVRPSGELGNLRMDVIRLKRMLMATLGKEETSTDSSPTIRETVTTKLEELTSTSVVKLFVK